MSTVTYVWPLCCIAPARAGPSASVVAIDSSAGHPGSRPLGEDEGHKNMGHIVQDFFLDVIARDVFLGSKAGANGVHIEPERPGSSYRQRLASSPRDAKGASSHAALIVVSDVRPVRFDSFSACPYVPEFVLSCVPTFKPRSWNYKLQGLGLSVRRAQGQAGRGVGHPRNMNTNQKGPG
jgi:hypothetical protein